MRLLSFSLFCALSAVCITVVTEPAAAQQEIAPFKRRIVGGDRADIKQHPWQVALNIKVSTGNALCGGSIIEQRWVLTAAYCFVGTSVRAGDVQARAGSTSHTAPGPWLEVDRVVVHEAFDPQTFENDIALVKLKSSSLTPGGRVIPLAAPSVTVPTGQPLEVTGWGAIKEGGSGSSMLMKATLPLVDTGTCNANDSYAGRIKDSMMCAGATEGGIDSCQGDSGGPLVWRTSEGPVLVGVVSHGEGCARKLKYGVYTRVGAYRDWIDRVMASDRNGDTPSAPTAKPFTPVRVFFGTDRKQEKSTRRVEFGADRAARLQLGQAIVTVPKAKERRRGEFTRPTWWELTVLRVPPEGDPAKHFMILPDGFKLYTNATDFISAVHGHMKEAGDYKGHAFVFVHGFNVEFDTALYRTAQIAYDLGYDETDGVHTPFGTAFLYSWPSGGDPKYYVYDADSARLAVDYLHRFLDLIATQSGATHVHLIAHSMGNVSLLSALQKLTATPRVTPIISQIVLAAPDVDAAEFERIATAIAPVAKGITLYASSNDLAMKAAREMRRGVPRAGDIPSGGPVVVDKVYTIDVSVLSTEFFSLKHATYSSSRELLEDMRRILATGEHPPHKRNSNFLQRTKGHTPYWWYSH